MQTSDGNKILIKRSKIYSNVPNLSSLSLGELAINTYDGKIFARTETENLTSVKTFLNSEHLPYVYNDSLSGVIPKNGENNTSGLSSNILGGYGNDISGATSSIVNGENNNIESDFSLIGGGLNNKISNGADYSFIASGQNNLISHSNVFTFGSNLSSHANDFTYVNNLSANGTLHVKNRLEINKSSQIATLFVSGNKVGINTETPMDSLSINGNASVTQDLEITDFTKGVILRSPDNHRWRITISNSGHLTTTHL